jgi:hypothetical protein
MPNDPAPQAPVPSILNSLATFAANRNIISSLGGFLGCFMILGVLDQDQINSFVGGAQDVMNGLGIMVGGFKKIWLALPVGAVAALATFAGKAQLFNSSVFGALSKLGQKESKDAGIVVVAPAPIANSVPGDNVIPADRATVVVPTVIADAQAPAAPVVRASDVAAQPELVQK